MLVHGDYRTGNYLADESGVTAILDWEGAHLGDPVEDLGWVCVKSWRFGSVDKPAGGFGSREELWAAYERAGGAQGRSRAGALVGSVRHRTLGHDLPSPRRGGISRARVKSMELASIGRRAVETEVDLLQLLKEARLRWRRTVPPPSELLAAIADFLREEATPALDRSEPRLGFQMRVAVNSLAILEREGRLGPAADAREHARLVKLLGRDGTLAELNRELARQLRTGERDERDAALMAHLEATIADKIAIANPEVAVTMPIHRVCRTRSLRDETARTPFRAGLADRRRHRALGCRTLRRAARHHDQRRRSPPGRSRRARGEHHDLHGDRAAPTVGRTAGNRCHGRQSAPIFASSRISQQPLSESRAADSESAASLAFGGSAVPPSTATVFQARSSR